MPGGQGGQRPATNLSKVGERMSANFTLSSSRSDDRTLTGKNHPVQTAEISPRLGLAITVGGLDKQMISDDRTCNNFNIKGTRKCPCN